jgi:hypothetical protein
MPGCPDARTPAVRESSDSMSDDVLSVIPTNPYWQPERAAAAHI